MYFTSGLYRLLTLHARHEPRQQVRPTFGWRPGQYWRRVDKIASESQILRLVEYFHKTMKAAEISACVATRY